MPAVLIIEPLAATSVPALEQHMSARGHQTLQHLGDFRLISLAPGEDPVDALDAYRRSGLVAIVEPNTYSLTPYGSGGGGAEPDDPDYDKQWHLDRIRAPWAWNLTTGDPSVKIAVLDSGLDGEHSEFAGTPIGPARSELVARPVAPLHCITRYRGVYRQV
jgi:subtilisin family serine protease